MALVHWNPSSDFDSLRQELNRLFDDSVVPRRRPNGGTGFTPVAELENTSDGYQLRLEIPGVHRDDVNIEVTAQSVLVSGERRSGLEEGEGAEWRSEFRYGAFQRVIPLPGRIDHKQVTAEYRDGILHLALPKAEEEKSKVVKVSVS